MLLAQATVMPSPTPTIGPCFHEANIVKPVRPDWPAGLSPSVGRFTVQVVVTVEPDGSVKSTSLWQPGSYRAAVAETVKAAWLTTYSPKVVDCKPVRGQYLFRADFAP